jgi:hypothetical protein
VFVGISDVVEVTLAENDSRGSVCYCGAKKYGNVLNRSEMDE